MILEQLPELTEDQYKEFHSWRSELSLYTDESYRVHYEEREAGCYAVCETKRRGYHVAEHKLK